MLGPHQRPLFNSLLTAADSKSRLPAFGALPLEVTASQRLAQRWLTYSVASLPYPEADS